MTKLKFFMALSLVSKLVIIASLYFVLFKTSLVAGCLVLLSHLAYEFSEFMIEREVYKKGQEAVAQLYEKLTMGSGGGHC